VFESYPLRVYDKHSKLFILSSFYHTQRPFVIQQISYISILSRISYCGSPPRKPLLIKALVREDGLNIVRRWGRIPVMKF